MVATGGQARLVAKGSKQIQHVDEFLTLTGLRYDLGEESDSVKDIAKWPRLPGRRRMLPKQRRLPAELRETGQASAMDNWNYFNYFTEIEEHFWKKRGAHLLVSPLDWAIMETWQKAGVPLEAALKGIDRAFESYQRSRRGAGKPLKSLAYCTDAVLEAAEEQQEAAAGAQPRARRRGEGSVFARPELRTYLQRNADLLRKAAGRLESTQQESLRVSWRSR